MPAVRAFVLPFGMRGMCVSSCCMCSAVCPRAREKISFLFLFLFLFFVVVTVRFFLCFSFSCEL